MSAPACNDPQCSWPNCGCEPPRKPDSEAVRLLREVALWTYRIGSAHPKNVAQEALAWRDRINAHLARQPAARSECVVVKKYLAAGGHNTVCVSNQTEGHAAIAAIFGQPAARQPEGQWRPIETAPKDGTHILAAIFDGGIGFGWLGKPPVHQAEAAIVHWFDGALPGFYRSNWGGDERFPSKYTHWQPLMPLHASSPTEGDA